MPPNTVCVTRGRYFKFGNPFREGSNADSAGRFHDALVTEIVGLERGFPAENVHMRYIAEHLHELKGKNLACFCSPELDCHADILLHYANKETTKP